MTSHDQVRSNEQMAADGRIISNEQTSSVQQIDFDGHRGRQSTPASCRRLSPRLVKVAAALVTLCTAVILGSVAVLHSKHNGEAGLRFSRRRNGIRSGPDVGSGAGGGVLTPLPPAGQTTLLSSLPKFGRFFGFNPIGNVDGKLEVDGFYRTGGLAGGDFKRRGNLAGERFHPKGNVEGDDLNPNENIAVEGFKRQRSLHELDTLPRVGDIVNGEKVERPPTLLFMHLWKCAGSSLRHLLREWAELEGQSIAIVVRCTEAVAEVSRRYGLGEAGEGGG